MIVLTEEVVQLLGNILILLIDEGDGVTNVSGTTNYISKEWIKLMHNINKKCR